MGDGGVFAKSFAAGFFGKLAGALFIAICLGLGFGPDKWAKFIMTGLPSWVTPGRAQAVFLTLAALTFVALAWTPVRRVIASFSLKGGIPGFGAKKITKFGRSIADKVEKATAQDAIRYMTAYETLHYLADDSEWGDRTRHYIGTDGARKIALLEAPVEFKRIAEQGGIYSVGRLNGVGLHVAIPETYWVSATLSSFSLDNRGISETTPAVPNPDGIPVYKAVKILRADVERLWPAGGDASRSQRRP